MKNRIEQLKKDIDDIKKEMNEGIDIDKRIHDLIKMKTYFQGVKENSELRRSHFTGSTMKKEKKANYQRTLERQKKKAEGGGEKTDCARGGHLFVRYGNRF